MRVVFGHLNSATPARFYHNKNLLFINEPIFKKYSDDAQKLVLLHELAHSHGVIDEVDADAFAFDIYKKDDDNSLKASLEFFKDLPSDYPEARERQIKALERVAHHDFVENGNKKVLNILKEIQMDTDLYANGTNYIADSMQPFIDNDEYSDFLGMGKKAAERRKERHQARMEKKEAKNAIRLARAQGIKDGTYKSGVGEALGGIAQGISGFLGLGGGGAAATEKSTPANNDGNGGGGDVPEKKNNSWIIWVVVAVILIIIGYFAFFRKKKK